MIYKAVEGHSGYTIGILLLADLCPHIPGDVANASTYKYPVLLETLKGVKFERLLARDDAAFQTIYETALMLEKKGAKAITADCGFFYIFQERLAKAMNIPVFMSSLLQVPFMQTMVGDKKVGVITTAGENLDLQILAKLGINPEKMVIAGMEHTKAFAAFAYHCDGTLDKDAVEKELVDKAKEIVKDNKDIGAILMECSMTAPYSATVQKAVGLPVFDFITMINNVHASLSQSEYKGMM